MFDAETTFNMLIYIDCHNLSIPVRSVMAERTLATNRYFLLDLDLLRLH